MDRRFIHALYDAPVRRKAGHNREGISDQGYILVLEISMAQSRLARLRSIDYRTGPVF